MDVFLLKFYNLIIDGGLYVIDISDLEDWSTVYNNSSLLDLSTRIVARMETTGDVFSVTLSKD